MEEARGEGKELALLKVAVENTNEAFVTIDQRHRVIFFNKAAERMFGYSRDEIVGKDIAVIMSPECRDGHKQAVQRYLLTRQPRLIGHETEFIAGRKNGEKFPANISFSVTQLEGEIYFTAIIRDLSETKELEDKVSRAERLAVLGQFVAEISHEIKNPLMTIGGFARQLINTNDDPKNLRKLEIIVEEVARLEKLLFEMREYYRPRGVSLEQVNLDNLLEEVLDMMRDDAAERSIALELTHDGAPVIALGSEHKLKQVFLNIVKNSLEASEKDGRIVVDIKENHDLAEILLSDNGPGMKPEVLEKAFNPFFTTKPKGSGLGLPLSKRIIEEHPCGTFKVNSEAGKGTTVAITLALPKTALECIDNRPGAALTSEWEGLHEAD